MSYKYKLSRRLAQIFYSFPALGIVLLYAACAGEEKTSSFGPAIDTTTSSIVVTPETTIANVGDTVHIDAYGSSEMVSNVPVEVDWQVSGGSITPTGDFRADLAGVYKVSGWTRNEARVADTVSLTVQANGGGGLGAPGCTNEPSGYTKISENPWNSVPAPFPAVDGFGWSSRVSDMFRLRVQNDPTAPRSGGNVLAGLFQQGSQGGGAPFKMIQRFDQNYRAVYMCLWQKLDPGFTNNGNTGTKFGFLLTPYNQGFQSLNHYFNLTDNPGVNLQSTGAALNRNMSAAYNMLNHLGEWHKIEWLVVANNAGKHDGIARIWIDGNPVLDETDVEYFFPQQTPAFTGVTWNPTYGGGHNPVPHDMYQWIDHWYISGQ